MVIRGRLHQNESWEPSSKLSDAPLRFLDLETTGLHPERGQRITEAAMLGRCGELLHEKVRDTHGGDAELVVRLVEAIDDVIVVGHNIVFDLRFIAQRAQRLGTGMPQTACIDTLHLARQLEPGGHRNYRLAAVARRLGLDIPDRLHRALPDARLARAVFKHLVERCGLETLSQVDVRRVGWRGQ